MFFEYKVLSFVERRASMLGQLFLRLALRRNEMLRQLEKRPVLIIKIGSGIVLTQSGEFNWRGMHPVIGRVKAMVQSGMQVILVLSGSVAHGRWAAESRADFYPQVAASYGWSQLTAELSAVFLELPISPLLLCTTPEGDIERSESVLDFLLRALECGFVPVLNEFDALQLNGFGGNDLLAAKVAILLGAERVVILTTPNDSPFGVGGREAKETALALLRDNGISAYVVNDMDHLVL
jgi:glutamate 5-kinase